MPAAWPAATTVRNGRVDYTIDASVGSKLNVRSHVSIVRVMMRLCLEILGSGRDEITLMRWLQSDSISMRIRILGSSAKAKNVILWICDAPLHLWRVSCFAFNCLLIVSLTTAGKMNASIFFAVGRRIVVARSNRSRVASSRSHKFISS